jgi:hypothetical protein
MAGTSWDALSQDEKLAHWEESTRLLREVLAMLPGRLPAEDRAAVERYLGMNELGVAFDHMVGALVAEEIVITPDDVERLAALAHRFGLPEREWRTGLVVSSA